MNKTALRIMNDYVDFAKNKPDGIYLWIDKTNISQQYAMIVGPNNTPYFGGYFFFDIKFPSDYPANPPQIMLLTVNNVVRFNPNLYEGGKVCLSIIGTWNGPGWKPIMNIRLVLCSIMSLMGEIPLTNEPGFENIEPMNESSIQYNTSIIYHTYSLAIMDVIEGKFEKLSKLFEKEIKEEMNKNYNKLKDDLMSYQLIYGKVPIKKHVYFMKNETLDFNTLLERFNTIKII
jgi:ubiquitin-conjugating enzyme E2 Z